MKLANGRMNATVRNTPQHGHSVGRDERGKRVVSPTYRTWRSMKARCDNPNVNGYERYGGRGISYDIRWSTFVNFLADMGERPTGMTLDRVDGNRDYYKENCKWSTRAEQQSHRKGGLTEDQVALAKSLLAESVYTQKQVAYEVGCDAATISNIATGKHRKVR